MNKLLKYAALGAAALVALLAIAVAILFALFDPNDYKPLLVAQAQQRWQRTLAIPGPISLSVFPNLAVKLGEVSLSEPNKPETTFVSLRSARVSLALWPLLRKQVVVDRIELTGLQARLLRSKDGRLNIDDLLGPASEPAAPAAAASQPATQALGFDIGGIAITDANLAFDDRQGGRRVVLSKAALRSGRIVPGQPVDASFEGHVNADAPVLDADITLKTGLTLDPAAGRHGVKDLVLEIAGRVATLPSLKASLKLPQAQWQAERLVLPALALELDVALPAGAPLPRLALKAGGKAEIDLAKHKLDSTLEGQLDQSRFKLQFGMPSFAPAAFRFELDLDALDLDRYRPAPAKAAASAPAGAAPEAPLDVSALRDLDARGSLRIGALQVAGLKARALRADLNAAGGRLALNPLAAELYEGRLAGSLTLLANQATPRLATQQTLAGIAVGPLLQDLMGKPLLEGRGSVALDVNAQGATVTALKKALAGSAKIELRDGMVHGINIAQTLRSAKAKLGGGGEHQGTGSQAEATDFSALTGSFKIEGGVAHNDDLSLVSPLLRIGGNGDIDIGESRLDYLVKATVVATLEGQGGPELQALRGQTIPVRLKGPFTAVGYSVDFAGMAKEALRGKVDDKAKEAAAKAKERLGDKLKGLLGK